MSRQHFDQGYAEAQNNLGLIFKDGLGTPQNYGKALEWYLKAADQGNLDAIMNIGNIYNKGLGVPADYEKALAWLFKAVKLGSDKANDDLANHIAYFATENNQIGYMPIAEYYSQQAQQGKDGAMSLLGVMYYKGLGVKKDFVLAHMLFNLGASLNNTHSRILLNKISSKLTPTQLREAQELASSWSIGTPLPSKSKSGFIDASTRKRTGVTQLP